MKAKPLHAWDLSTEAARHLQEELAPLVIRASEIDEPPSLVAGVDISDAARDKEALGPSS